MPKIAPEKYKRVIIKEFEIIIKTFLLKFSRFRWSIIFSYIDINILNKITN